MAEDRCVCCGAIIPEGLMVCPNCQISLFDVSEFPKPMKDDEKKKRNWENGFQRWSNKQFADHEYDQPLGCCGYGSMCDYCDDNSYGRPCVRALNEMCRDRGIRIDYEKKNYEDIWNGVFTDGN